MVRINVRLRISSYKKSTKTNYQDYFQTKPKQNHLSTTSFVKQPIIQWYPGHIAKAEKQLRKNLDKVDLIIEVRDARIPLSTSHPHLNNWIEGKKHLLVINRKDMISNQALKYWDNYLRVNGCIPWWSDAQKGTGIQQIKLAAIRSGEELNNRRASRGMKSRAVRALTLGFPNVGKSALINRLVKKKVVSSSRRAGVTRSLRWIRLGQDLDLLDAPGVLPPRLENQVSAMNLAICDDIGEAAYDIELVAINFIQIIRKLEQHKMSGIKPLLLEEKYGVKKHENIHQWLLLAAERHTSGNTRRMSQRLLDDFRKSLLGTIALEVPK